MRGTPATQTASATIMLSAQFLSPGCSTIASLVPIMAPVSPPMKYEANRKISEVTTHDEIAPIRATSSSHQNEALNRSAIIQPSPNPIARIPRWTERIP